MKLVSALQLLVALLTASNGESGVRHVNKRELSPENAGAFHTVVFKNLADKYRIEHPKSISHYIKDVGDVMSDFCDKGNMKCISEAYKQTVNQFAHVSKKGTSTLSNAHEKFEGSVRSALDRTYELVDEFGSTEEKDLDYFVSEMDNILDELKGMTDEDEAQRLIALGSVSVGIDSAKYWHEAYYDETNPFYGALRNKLDGNRRLTDTASDVPEFKDFFPIPWKKVVRADIDGGVNTSIAQVNAAPGIIFDWGELMMSILVGAAPASAAVLFEPRPDNATKPYSYKPYYDDYWYE